MKLQKNFNYDQYNPLERDPITDSDSSQEERRMLNTRSFRRRAVADLKPIIKNLGLQEAVKVKIRKNGITSVGGLNCCHANASYFALMFGGECVRGFYIDVKSVDELGDLSLMYSHSVWKTPEGELVDVSLKWTGLDDIIFYPDEYSDPCKQTTMCPVDIVKFQNDAFQIDEMDFKDSEKKKYIFSKKKIKQLTQQNFNIADEFKVTASQSDMSQMFKDEDRDYYEFLTTMCSGLNDYINSKFNRSYDVKKIIHKVIINDIKNN